MIIIQVTPESQRFIEELHNLPVDKHMYQYYVRTPAGNAYFVKAQKADELKARFEMTPRHFPCWID